jgi:type I protein arginine methyltransferase
MSKATGYRIDSYGDMITNRPRMEPYVQALRQAIRPGCVVVDIGAGTGIFSMLACKFGAGQVHAIEPDDAIAVARDIAAANGFADRIIFHQALSTEVILPVQADVIISDLRGVLPLFQYHVPAIADARKRLLAPGCVLIPHRDTLWAALMEDPEIYRPYAEPWLTNEYGLDMQAGQPIVTNSWRKIDAMPDQLLVTPQQWATLDYTSIENPNIEGGLTWAVERAGTAHGLIVWFDAELADGIGFSNSPGQPKLIYGQAFFPLQSPLVLKEGDRVSAQLAANLSEGEYVWRWNTAVFSEKDAAKPRAAFRQSTFFGAPLALERLRCRAAEYVPSLPESGHADFFILSLIDGRSTLGDIAKQAMERFPSLFSRWEKALSRAGELAEKYRR